jgi:hypothetical protein
LTSNDNNKEICAARLALAWAILAIALSAVSAMPAIAPWVVGAAVAVPVAVSVWLSRRASGYRREAIALASRLAVEAEHTERHRAYVESLKPAAGQIMRRWSRHIATASEETENGITDLSRQFGKILQGISSTMQTSAGGSETAVEAAIAQGRADLSGMLAGMERGLAAKEPLLEQVAALNEITGELNRSSAQSSRGQTGIAHACRKQGSQPGGPKASRAKRSARSSASRLEP